MNREDKTENPWCVYGYYLGPWGFGKVIKEYKSGTLEILYSEGQLYSPECWDSDWVKRFSTLTEAVEHYIENRPRADIRTRQVTPNEVRLRARRDFPSYYKDILPMVIAN